MKITFFWSSQNTASIAYELWVDNRLICHALEIDQGAGQAMGVGSIPAGEYQASLRREAQDRWNISIRGIPGHPTFDIKLGAYGSIENRLVKVGNTLFNVGNNVSNESDAYLELDSVFIGLDSNQVSNVDITITGRPITPTEYWFDSEPILIYQNFGRWTLHILGDASLTEICRTPDYIFLAEDQSKTFDCSSVRVGIVNGEISTRNSPVEPWEIQGTATRKN